MEPDRSDATLRSDEMSRARSSEMSRSSGRSTSRSLLGWGPSLALGLITLVIGLILIFQTAASLFVIAVLLGVVMIVSGVYHVVRALDNRERDHRVWRGIAGVLFILAGLVLLRNLHLSIALIGVFVGFTWIIQGVMLLMEGFSRDRGRTGRAVTGWTMLFGIISLIAGIVVVVAPIASIFALTIFMGAWFIVLGLMEIFGSFVARRAAPSTLATEGVSVPQQRTTAVAADQGTAVQGPTVQGTTGQGVTGQDTADQAAPGGIAGQGTVGDSRPTSRHWHIRH
jgi:uncharacterized membrane protein HdeD (DUF308 family)